MSNKLNLFVLLFILTIIAVSTVTSAQSIKAERDAKYIKWLSATVNVANGSGVIVYYDEESGYAYVQSCGHHWKGKETADDLKNKQIITTIKVWYHNDIKLDNPESYNGEVLYYYGKEYADISLIRFKPKWRPKYIALAPKDFKLKKYTSLHSLGSDFEEGREPSHYFVEYIGSNGSDIVTANNSPRKGRSGGGLFTENYCVGICRANESYVYVDGLFVPFKLIKKINEQNGYGWLNEKGTE